MTQKKNVEDIIYEIIEEKRSYKREAYYFVMAALDYYLDKIKERRHVTGQELLLGISEYAKNEFGPMVLTVFSHWGIKNTADFGHIVYHLIERGLLSKQADDQLADFENVYDLEKEFRFDFKDTNRLVIKKKKYK